MPYVKRTSRFDNKNVFYLLAFWQGSVVLEGNCKEGEISEGARRTCEVSRAGSCVLRGGKRKRSSKEGLKSGSGKIFKIIKNNLMLSMSSSKGIWWLFLLFYHLME